MTVRVARFGKHCAPFQWHTSVARGVLWNRDDDMMDCRHKDTGELYGFGATAHGASNCIRRRTAGLLSLVAAALCIALVMVIVTALPSDPAIAAHGLAALIN